MKAPTGKLAFAYRTIATLEGERDSLREDNRHLHQVNLDWADRYVAIEHERDTLRAEVERLQRELATAHADASHYASSAEDMRQQAARYERLRRLDPRQFAELHQRNLAGERFDHLVDAL